MNKEMVFFLLHIGMHHFGLARIAYKFRYDMNAFGFWLPAYNASSFGPLIHAQIPPCLFYYQYDTDSIILNLFIVPYLLYLMPHGPRLCLYAASLIIGGLLRYNNIGMSEF